jgi:hypothetical protein
MAIMNDILIELQDTTQAIYNDDEIQEAINDGLVEISKYVPYIVRETLTITPKWVASTAYVLTNFVSPTTENGYRYECTTAGTSGTTEPTWPLPDDDTQTVTDNTVVWTRRGRLNEIDISDLGNVMSIDRVEYPVDKNPREYRNFEELDSDTIAIDINFTPEAGKSVYVWCNKFHTLGTLKPQMTRILVQLAAAKLAISKAMYFANQVTEAKNKITTVETSISNMTARITQSLADIASGRTQLTSAGTAITSSGTSISNMSARITQAIADLTSGGTAEALAPAIILEANTAIDKIEARLTQTLADLEAARTKLAAAAMDDRLTNAETAVGKVAEEVGQAIADLDSGRSLINQLNVEPSPESDYAQYTGVGLGNSSGYLREAQGWLALRASEEAMVRDYVNLGLGEIRTGLSYLNEANSLLAQAHADESLGMTYVRQAVGQLQTATSYLNQGQGYLAQARTYEAQTAAYYNAAIRELSVAQSYQNQAAIYLQSITARLNITRIGRDYQQWGQSKLALVLAELRGMVVPGNNMAVRYPTE